VLTGEPIDARRALEWGLVEEVAADVDLALQKLVKSLLAGSPMALREQKRLLQLWDEAPLATAVAASIEAFRRTTISSTEKGKGN
jgi:enoyl-CoA hydratase/carnithine racemase